MQLRFGERNFVIFSSENEFYLCLGFLLNSKKGVRFDWYEDYENKWGIEGRIWIDSAANAPSALRAAFSAGTATVDKRLNCNEYILFLIRNFGIRNGRCQNLVSIESNIPSCYITDFRAGLAL